MTENNTWPEWRNVRKIGAGSFGTVYEIQKEADLSYFAALKVITIPHDEDELKSAYSEMTDEKSVADYFEAIVHEVEREIVVMKQFKGITNIVSYDDHKIIKHKNDVGWDILIRMELLTPMLDYITDKYGKEAAKNLPEEEVISLGKDICNALILCEKSNVIHRDIKPENIFVNKFNSYVLGDFGIARETEKSREFMSVKGTYSYMAPEVYNGQNYGKAVDIYSLGLVMYRFLNNNRVPFLPVNARFLKPEDRTVAFEKRMRGETPEAPVNGSEELKAVVMKAIAYNPGDRYQSASEFLYALNNLGDGDDVKTVVLNGSSGTGKTVAGGSDKNEKATAAGTDKGSGEGFKKGKKGSKLKWIIPPAAAGVAAAVIIPFILNGQHDNGTVVDTGHTAVSSEIQTTQSVSDENAQNGGQDPQNEGDTGETESIFEREYAEIFENGSNINETEPKNGIYGSENVIIPGTDLTFLKDKKFAGLTQLRLTGAQTADSKKLNSLKGIEALSGSLEKLFIDEDDEIDSLKPLAGMEKLKYLSVNRDTNIDNYVPLTEINSLESLSAAAVRKEDLSEELFAEKFKVLSGCRGLKALNLRNNNLTDISFLSEFDKLQVLDLSFNDIKDFSVLSGLPELKKLVIDGNDPDNYGFLYDSKIERFSMLKNDNLKSISEMTGDNKIKSVSVLSLNNCTNLADLNGIDKFTGLNGIYVSGTGISDISGLSSFKDMQEIDISYTKVNDITVLGSLEDLKLLFMADLHLTDLSPLKDLKELERISIKGNDVENLDDLKGMDNLKRVSCDSCEKLSDIKGLQKANLEKFYISDAQITSLEGLEKSTNMNLLRINNCPIEDITLIRRFTELTDLHIENTGVTDFSVLKGLTKLKYLSLEGSKISDVSVLEGLTDLKYLNLKSTGVSEQDVQKLRSVLKNCNIVYE